MRTVTVWFYEDQITRPIESMRGHIGIRCVVSVFQNKAVCEGLVKDVYMEGGWRVAVVEVDA